MKPLSAPLCLIAVAAGAAGVPGDCCAGEPLWTARPLLRPVPPAVLREDLVETPVDRFLEARLEAQGLTLGPEAPPEILARRVAFDLTGLPLGETELSRFLADRETGAYERLVERLLASPRHGERWAKHWLEAAGYAESNGYFSADSERPLAHKYRDYVVRALNEDRPLSRFLEEQIAGDELVGFVPGGDVTPDMVEALTATHFLRNAQDGTGESDGNPTEVLIDKTSVLDGTVQILGACLLGVTVQCARCHDHKFDPFPQADYYALHAILAPAYSVREWRKPAERLVTVGTREERSRNEAARAAAEAELEALRRALDGVESPLRDLLVRERARDLPESDRAPVLKALEVKEKNRDAAQKALLEKHGKALSVTPEELARRFPELPAAREPIFTAIQRVEKARPAPLAEISVLWDVDPEVPAQHVLLRGSVTDPGPQVSPGVPVVFRGGDEAAAFPGVDPGPLSSASRSSGRRLAFARWVSSRSNPVVPRVLANRLWQNHFGTGIVSTSENLGATGARPIWPELLDWLARELVDGGSWKNFHRMIVLSRGYRQSSLPREEGTRSDTENHLLWKFPLLRLDAESLRDASLAVSGRLDTSVGGRPTSVHEGPDGQFLVDETKPGAFRRSIYLEQRRTRPTTILEVFDAPLIVSSCTRRAPSTTPLQSLALLNSDFSRKCAEALAAALLREARVRPEEPREACRLAFGIVTGRGPTAGEEEDAFRFLCGGDRVGSGATERFVETFALLIQMLFASSSFLYVE